MKKQLHIFLLFSLIFFPAFSTALTLQEQAQEQAEAVKPQTIPVPVKTAIEAGLQTRQPRLDISFSINKHLFFPAKQNMHNIFLFTIKNADLNYLPVASTEIQVQENETPAKLTTRSVCYLQFNSLEESVPGPMVKEVYIPIHFETEASYDPEAEVTCSTAYPLPPGKYRLSMAITTEDMEKIGVQYYDFDIPGPSSFKDTITTTPLFFVEKSKQLQAPEVQAEVHLDYFVYSVIQITPNLKKEFSSGDNVELFFFILGAQPNEQRKYDVEVEYEILQNDKTVIRYAKQTYEYPLIIQTLPLKRTVLIKKGEEEKKETRDLEAGEYTLNLKILDKISGKTAIQTIGFSAK